MTANDILAKLQTQFPQLKLELQKGSAGDTWLLVPSSHILSVLQFLRNELHMDYLACLSGVDYETSLGVVYQLRSLAGKFELMLKVLLPKEAPLIASVARLYGAAEWFEREAYDLIGIQFEGHPDLRRIMMPDDWIGHPLRKDYQPPQEYHGIPCERPDSHRVLDPLYPTPPEKESTTPAITQQ